MGPSSPGDTHIQVSGNGTISAGTLIRLGTTADGDEEYVIAASEHPAAPAPRVITLQTPAALAHPGGATHKVDILPDPGAPADHTTLDVSAAAGDAAILVADNTNFITAGQFIRIKDAVHAEVRRLGNLGTLALTLPAYADYLPGASVEVATSTDATGTNDKTLTAEAPAGSNIVVLDERQNLNVGDVLRIGQAADPEVEYMVISAIPNRLSGSDPGRVVLTAALQSSHPNGATVRVQTITRTPTALTHPVLPTPRNSTELLVSDTTDITAPGILRVSVGPQAVYYHRLDVAPITPTPAVVSLSLALGLPHPAGSSIADRDPLLLVRALDPGSWGNQLRVSVQDQSSPLVKTRIRLVDGVVDSTHIRLDSANGIEVGTVLQLVDANHNFVDTPFKVTDIDRLNGYLLTLAAPLPSSATPGSAVWSREFQLNVYLLRQPDPAVPTRNEQVLDAETFRNLSVDPRHSRYLHRVIGTTWSSTPGTTNDDDNQPLRLADRRSQGESAYIRVRDQNPTDDLRLGPEPLVDVLPSGQPRPTRRPLLGGFDALGSISDADYIGQDDPNPENRTGLQSLSNIDEISIVACPGRTTTGLQAALIDHCELLRYRFAVLDGPPPPQDTLSDVQNQRQQFDTKYAALYHPWLLIPDPFPTNLANIPDYAIPSSGHVLGVFARTDIERGVHKAPANEVVRGITGLQRLLNKEQQDILNPYPVNINVIRDFRDNNRGIRVWGGRILTSDPDWKYVNVRRLLIFIEASIDRGLQWVVFEPNAEPLWARVRRSISNFLTVVWRNGALEGTKPEEAYFVKCDRTTMTQTDIDNGRLIIVIGVAPVKPAEFVIVRIGLWTANAED